MNVVAERVMQTWLTYRRRRPEVEGWGCLKCPTRIHAADKPRRSFLVMLLHKFLIHGEVGVTTPPARQEIRYYTPGGRS